MYILYSTDLSDRYYHHLKNAVKAFMDDWNFFGCGAVLDANDVPITFVTAEILIEAVKTTGAIRNEDEDIVLSEGIFEDDEFEDCSESVCD